MPDAIFSEIMKMRKNRMAWIGSLIVILIPILLILKRIFLDSPEDTGVGWLMTVLMIHALVLPIASGFVITVTVQKEYQEKTIRNILTAPASRNNFVIAKLVVWFLWHLVTFCLAGIVTAAGYYFLFPNEINIVNIQYILYLFTQNSIFSFVSLLPVLWIAVKQQSLFYPAMLVTLGITALQMAGRQVSKDMLLFASICPWTAVAVSGMVDFGTRYFWICSVSTLLCGVVGILGAFVSFRGQDQ